MAVNDAQREFWNGKSGQIWVESQQRLDAMFTPITELAIERCAVQAGERVIDVGCGCGGTSFALAAQGAAVWGVDISQPMIEHARARAAREDLAGEVAFSVADAAVQSYTADHQLVFSRFGVMFFDDPIAAFTNIRTALSAQGRLVFVCWQPPGKNPWMSVAGRAIQPYLPPQETPDPRAPGPFAFADADWVHEILTSAGFSDLRIDPITPTLKLAQDLDEAMQFQAKVGPLARMLDELDEAGRVKAEAAAREALSEYLTEDGLFLGSSCWLVSAGASG